MTKEEYAQLKEQMDELTEKRLEVLAGEGNDVMVFNTTGILRDDVAYLGDCDADYLSDSEGHQYPVQKRQMALLLL